MKVRELIEELQKFDAEAEVGGGFLKYADYANEVTGVEQLGEIVVVDLGRETIGGVGAEFTASMRPSQLAQALRQIAAKIDNSKSPKRELVARDLKRTLAAVGISSFENNTTEQVVGDLYTALNTALQDSNYHPSETDELIDDGYVIYLIDSDNEEEEDSPDSEKSSFEIVICGPNADMTSLGLTTWEGQPLTETPIIALFASERTGSLAASTSIDEIVKAVDKHIKSFWQIDRERHQV
jgi:hypothetical protein